MKKQKGFTLIELIIVIIILGILAAFAVPKFVDFSTEANKAVVKGLGGSIHAAAVMVRGIAIAKGVGNGGTVNIGTSDVVLNTDSRYPAENAAGIDASLSDTTGFTYNATSKTYTKDGAPTPATCSVKYEVTTDVYTVTVTETGC